MATRVILSREATKGSLSCQGSFVFHQHRRGNQMRRYRFRSLITAILLLAVATTSNAQEMRRRSADASGAAPTAGVPRDARFPYAGVWTGIRTMPVGSDDIGLRFTVA